MSTPTITKTNTVEKIGKIPGLFLRPTGPNLYACVVDLVTKLQGIPCYSAPNHGYSGMVDEPAIYALSAPGAPWTDWPDPGPHRTINPSLKTAGQADSLVNFTFKKGIFDSETYMRTAIIDAMNIAIPKEYRRAINGALGARNYPPTGSPRAIFAALIKLHGKISPSERTAQDTKWSTQWNPAFPIETYFDRLGDVFVMSITNLPAYTE